MIPRALPITRDLQPDVLRAIDRLRAAEIHSFLIDDGTGVRMYGVDMLYSGRREPVVWAIQQPDGRFQIDAAAVVGLSERADVVRLPDRVFFSRVESWGDIHSHAGDALGYLLSGTTATPTETGDVDQLRRARRRAMRDFQRARRRADLQLEAEARARLTQVEAALRDRHRRPLARWAAASAEMLQMSALLELMESPTGTEILQRFRVLQGDRSDAHWIDEPAGSPVAGGVLTEGSGAFFESGSSHAIVEPETVQTLLDLAREGQEAEFRELAACVGVPAEKLDALWAGTVKRLKHDGGLKVQPDGT